MSIPMLCPNCRSPLALRESDTGLYADCLGCGTIYPRFGTIPLLLNTPDQARARWALALKRFCSETRASERAVLAQLLDYDLGPKSKHRLRELSKALVEYRTCIEDLFVGAGLDVLGHHEDGSQEEEASVLSYYSLIFRDYAWAPEIDEVTPALDQLRKILPPGLELGRTLVVGAGTGRLAWEFCQGFGATEIVALDTNPLPYLVTSHLLAGKEVRLFELPGHPRHSTWAVRERVLMPPAPPSCPLHLMFADALRLPFPEHTFDTVVTPWFIDQVPSDARSYAREVANVLVQGGTWINQGPLIYDPKRTVVAHRYCGDEMIELVRAEGFSVVGASYEPMPYLASPISSQARSEHVLTFVATRAGQVGQTRTSEYLSADATEALVPALDVPEALMEAHPLLRRLSQIANGRRTVNELTSALVAEGLLVDDGSARAAVIGALRILHHGATRGTV